MLLSPVHLPGLEAGAGLLGSPLFWDPEPPKSSLSVFTFTLVPCNPPLCPPECPPISQAPSLSGIQMRKSAQAAYLAPWPPTAEGRASFSGTLHPYPHSGVQHPLSAPSGSSLSVPVVPRLLICPPEPPLPSPLHQVPVWLRPNGKVRTPCHVPIHTCPIPGASQA